MYSFTMNLKIPESYKDVTTVAIKGIRDDSDTVICTTDKKLMTFFKGCLIKNCRVEINVKHLEPFIEYEPKIVVYYILHGDNKVVIVKDGTSLEIIKTYVNVYEITVNDYTNSGTSQLYMRTDKGFECVDIAENKEQNSIENNSCKLQETSVLYKFCVNKLQKLKMLYDMEKNKLSEEAASFVNAVKQLSSNNNISDVTLSSNIVTKNSWLKLSNENLVYGFTLQNTSKLPISDFSIILLENNKRIWSRYRFECWAIEQNRNAFKFYDGYEHNCTSNKIEKCCTTLNSESSMIVASVLDDWSFKSLPYFVNGLVYINNEKCDRLQYFNTDEIMVSTDLFLNKEFATFVKNSVFVEDLVTLRCTALSSCYKIKYAICLNDLTSIMVDNFKFDTKNEWLVNSPLSWLRTIVCHLDRISPFEYILQVFSESSVYKRTFIQTLATMLPENTSINGLDDSVSTRLNIDAVVLDLKKLRRVFKEHLNEQIIIPRHRWNSVRSNLTSEIV